MAGTVRHGSISLGIGATDVCDLNTYKIRDMWADWNSEIYLGGQTPCRSRRISSARANTRFE